MSLIKRSELLAGVRKLSHDVLISRINKLLFSWAIEEPSEVLKKEEN